MPSSCHEALIQLFRNRPDLAPKLLRDEMRTELPPYTDIRVESADFAEVQPAEYRADLVLSLADGAPVLGIIVEVQLSIDTRKRFTWPVYVANLRARWRCPVCLLVVCMDMKVARWAATPTHIGCTNMFTPRVLPIEIVPEITDEADATENPELAALSAALHGHDVDVSKAACIANVALGVSAKLDADRSKLYFDLVLNSVSDAVREALAETMQPFKYEYQSDFAKHYVAEGRAQGRVEIVTRQLAARFGALSPEVKDRIRASSAEDLDAIADRLLVALTLDAVLNPQPS